MMKAVLPFCMGIVISATAFAGPLPEEPIEIGDRTQVLFDGYIVDNHWAIRFGKEVVRRVSHAPEKHPANPLIAGRGGYINVLYDEQADLYRMWYQEHNPKWREQPEHPKYGIAYAESDDGITWRVPALNQYEWPEWEHNNICYLGPEENGASGGHVIDASTIPEADRCGYRYIMVYSDRRGMNLVGSRDGIHWDADGDMNIKHIHSDTYNNILYDLDRERYIMTLRPKDIYRAGQDGMIDSGMSRRVARQVNDELWTQWSEQQQNLLIPDETDAERGFTAYYGMGLSYVDGVFWGFIWPFSFNDDIYTELITSRDAEHYQRLPWQPRLIDMGEEDTWDDGMVFGGPRWIEVGNQWRLYYAGHDGPHGSRERTGGIGLATIRKHGFISMRGPDQGGVVCTRKLVWPGGDLVVNADTRNGELTVRVSDAQRKPLDGFDHTDCVPFRGNSTDHVVQWNNRSMDELAGEVIRLEFYIQKTDLFSFRAASGDVPDGAIGSASAATPEPIDLAAASEAPTGGEEVLDIAFNEGEGDPADEHGATITMGDGENQTTYPTWIEDGRQGAAMNFNRPGCYLRVHKSVAYRPASGRLELWFRPEQNIDRELAINKYLLNIHKTGALRAALMISDDDGALHFYSRMKDDVTLDIRSDNARWEAGRWYHVTVAFGEGGLRMYVDGELQHETDPSTRGLDYLDAGSMFVGSALPRFGDRYSFPGDIDELRIYAGEDQ